jgi:hypothetical protein
MTLMGKALGYSIRLSAREAGVSGWLVMDGSVAEQIIL